MKSISAEPRNADEWRLALELAQSPNTHALRAALADPVNRRTSVAVLAARFGITPTHLAEIWRGYKLHAALGKAIDSLPALVEDMIADAMSSQVTCPVCGGEGEVRPDGGSAQKAKNRAQGRVCTTCNGTGTVRKPGDASARRLLFDAVGWRQASAPIQVNTLSAGYGVENMIDEIERLQSPRSGNVIDGRIRPSSLRPVV